MQTGVRIITPESRRDSDSSGVQAQGTRVAASRDCAVCWGGLAATYRTLALWEEEELVRRSCGQESLHEWWFPCTLPPFPDMYNWNYTSLPSEEIRKKTHRRVLPSLFLQLYLLILSELLSGAEIHQPRKHCSIQGNSPQGTGKDHCWKWPMRWLKIRRQKLLLYLNFLCQHHRGQLLINTSSKKEKKIPFDIIMANSPQGRIGKNAYIFHVKIHQ